MKNFLLKIGQFLSSNNAESSLRLNLFIITIGALVIELCIATYIIIEGIVENKTIDWYGLSAFMLSLGGFLTSIYYQKVAQYKIETQKKNDNENRI